MDRRPSPRRGRCLPRALGAALRAHQTALTEVRARHKRDARASLLRVREGIPVAAAVVAIASWLNAAGCRDWSLCARQGQERAAGVAKPLIGVMQRAPQTALGRFIPLVLDINVHKTDEAITAALGKTRRSERSDRSVRSMTGATTADHAQFTGSRPDHPRVERSGSVALTNLERHPRSQTRILGGSPDRALG